MSSDPPPLPSKPLLPALVDFGDWLSPMIVKELRQGLRTWIFVGAFIVLQALLVMTLMISTSSGNNEAASWFFWFLVAVILVYIVPLRGFNALAGEIRSQTLDALILTRLSAFRIAFGKWAALVLQAGLIAVSVLPYVLLRYFGGGINLLGELRGLLLFWMLAAAVASVAVACSALPSVIVRTLLLLATWVGAMIACTGLIGLTLHSEEMGFFMDVGSPSFWLVLLAALIPLWTYGCYFVIDMGASTIAPLAANHATRKRLISLGLMLVALAFVLALDHEYGRGMAFTCLMGIWALTALDSLTESPTTAVSVYTPFSKRGLPGRIAAWFLAPGWPTGLLFFLVTCGLIGIAWSADPWGPWDDEDLLAAGNIPGCALAPLALALLCFRRQQRMLGPFLVCSLILVIFGALIIFMTDVSNEDTVAYLGMISAPTALMAGNAASSPEDAEVLAGGIVSSIICLGIVVLHALSHFRAMAAALREAAGKLVPAPDHAPVDQPRQG